MNKHIIEVGKLVDLNVLVENPFEDIRNTNSIKFVILKKREEQC